MAWLQCNAREGRVYKDAFADRWASCADPLKQVELENRDLLMARCEFSKTVLDNFSATAASKLFEQEIREVVSSSICSI